MKRMKRTEMMIGVAVMLALMLTGKFAVEVKTEAAVTTSMGNILMVTSTADSGAGTLRQAIADAAAGDTIEFGLSLSYPATITLTSETLLIDKNLTIQGPGAPALTVSGNHAGRVFRVERGAIVTLS